MTNQPLLFLVTPDHFALSPKRRFWQSKERNHEKEIDVGRTVVVLVTGIGVMGASSASANPLTYRGVPSSQLVLPAGSSLKDVVQGVSNATREVGGWGLLGKVSQMVYTALRACPACILA